MLTPYIHDISSLISTFTTLPIGPSEPKRHSWTQSIFNCYTVVVADICCYKRCIIRSDPFIVIVQNGIMNAKCEKTFHKNDPFINHHINEICTL